MQAICAYRIQVQGRLEQEQFNTRSPYQITELQAGADTTQFSIYADQSGLVGLVRHLHQQGYVLLCVQRSEETKSSGG